MQKGFIATTAIFCALTQLAIASPQPTKPAKPAAPLTWMGVTLGQPESEVLTTTGETGFMYPEPAIAPMTSIAYNIDRATGLLDVSFHAGRVSSIGIRRSVMNDSAPSSADPHGITLAMSETDVTSKLGKAEITSPNGTELLTYKTKDGLSWRYSFRDNVMQWLDVTMPDAALDAMPKMTATVHTGSSFEDAMINGAADESSGAANERSYLLEQHCPSGHWWERQQALVIKDNHDYDVLTLWCANGDTKKLYIDVTSFYGKL